MTTRQWAPTAFLDVTVDGDGKADNIVHYIRSILGKSKSKISSFGSQKPSVHSVSAQLSISFCSYRFLKILRRLLSIQSRMPTVLDDVIENASRPNEAISFDAASLFVPVSLS